MKYILYINKLQREQNRGFTLLELLVVTIITGLLSTIAFPTLMNQVAKARETDAKNALGTIARSQQAYHFEQRQFANLIDNLNIAGLANSKYYNYIDPTVADSSIAKHQAIAINPTTDQIKNFAIGIYQAGGVFDISICQSFDVNQAVDVGNTVNDDCTNNGTKLK